jgi:hypothetical protein
MSPRGFYSKEMITPYFTSSKYINSDQGKEELDNYVSIENRLRSILNFPRKIWFELLIAIGFLAGPNQGKD